MVSLARSFGSRVYENLLLSEIDDGPTHVAVIQDGNRRYAKKRGTHTTNGHRAGAQTTEQVLNWCKELGIEELTLYAFSTENLERPPEEREALYDLLCEKLREFADAERVHDGGVMIRALGNLALLPDRVQEAARYAEERTREYGTFVLNIALAYGGRAELLGVARDVARAVEAGELRPAEIITDEIDRRLYDDELRDVDLIIRTGGDERTSNFLPWHANGNEAAVFFCAPYWPEFSKVDFLRAVRTYQHREASWQRTRTQRALALIGALSDVDLPKARDVLDGENENERTPETVAPAER
ncbi:MAG: di-trans,poly-cis-decaprenylcistransferase [Euryarchaeota archaeon]|nr:di-trans,poly-cis-decaprenylcistransferase [Euryarchaeota archaeon]